ncbi:hypothetical protein AB833_01520 [Chromatiales bacterium (ex Bugula neritina AB1)]|nr:hypothetical protein AB833_01520 [Chromatiales bacterium (ex Bugula neritina AB1)]
MDEREHELEYLRKQTNKLGAQLIRLKQEHIRANRAAARSRTTALLIRRIYTLINDDITDLDIETRFLKILLESVHIDHAVIFRAAETSQQLQSSCSIGLDAGHHTITTGGEIPEFDWQSMKAAAENPANIGAFRQQIERLSGARCYLWAYDSRHQVGLLLANQTEDSQLKQAFGPEDDALVSGSLSVFIEVNTRRQIEIELHAHRENLSSLVQQRTAELSSRTEQLQMVNTELKAHASELDTLSLIGQGLVSELDLHAQANVVLGELTRLFGTDTSVSVFGSDGVEIGSPGGGRTDRSKQESERLAAVLKSSSTLLQCGDQLPPDLPYRSWLGAPIVGDGDCLGAVVLQSTDSDIFAERQVQFISTVAANLGTAMQNAISYRRSEENARQVQQLNARLETENLRLGTELEIAKQLQRMVLPTSLELESVDQLEMASYMESADEVGGDYFDVLKSGDKVKIGIGDVTGHGLLSGVVMLMTQTAIRTLMNSGESNPVRFFDTLNRTIYDNIQRMCTDRNLTLALLDYTPGEIKLSGQHEELIVIRREGTVELIDTIDLGMPIAIDTEIKQHVDQTTVRLATGDGVVLYTDGVTEAENEKGELYGLSRLCEVASEHWGEAAKTIQKAIIEDVRRHIGSQEVFDDITLLVMKQR